ncbi:MAG: regulator of sirC expression with transglutaminase-like and TPR domain [Flavobacteriaceae bacterium]|jgi:regulator of sirC expression with transglutaminase-like and TPR domain
MLKPLNFVSVRDEKSIEALVRLIEDPDESVFEHVRDEIISCGSMAIPFLESSWEAEDFGLTFQARIENLIHEIQFSEIESDLTNWINSTDRELLAGSLIISRYQYPNLDESWVRSKIQEIRKDIWLELNDNQTAFEKVKVFNKIFYGKHRFIGNSKDYHSPLNSCINTVLEMRKGNPLTLCVLYSVIAQSLDMPVYGINLPNHFVLTYLDENNINAHIDPENTTGSLFYINAFSKGGVFNDEEIRDFLKGLNKEEDRSYFEPCSNSAILSRMLTNLIGSFQQVGNLEKVNELLKLRELFDLNL